VKNQLKTCGRSQGRAFKSGGELLNPHTFTSHHLLCPSIRLSPPLAHNNRLSHMQTTSATPSGSSP